MQYQLLTGETAQQLAKKVNESLIQGWTLHGGTTCVPCGTNLTYAQAVLLGVQAKPLVTNGIDLS